MQLILFNCCDILPYVSLSIILPVVAILTFLWYFIVVCLSYY